MKKIVVCVLMLAMLCAGCDDNNSIYMKEIVNMKSAVSDVNVVHSNGGGVNEISLSNEQIVKLKSWISNTELTFVEFKDGEEPSNLAGGETYSFSSDSFDEFSFFDAGDQKYYIRINSNWYQVEENIGFSVTTEN